MLLRRALVAAALLTAGTEAFVLPVCVPGGCSGYAVAARPAAQRPALGLRMSATTGESGPISRKEKTKQKKAAKAEDSVRICYFCDVVEDCIHIHVYTCVHMYVYAYTCISKIETSEPCSKRTQACTHLRAWTHICIAFKFIQLLKLSAHLHTHMRSDMHVHVHQYSFFHAFMYTACLSLPHWHERIQPCAHTYMHTIYINMSHANCKFGAHTQQHTHLHDSRSHIHISMHVSVHICRPRKKSSGSR